MIDEQKVLENAMHRLLMGKPLILMSIRQYREIERYASKRGYKLTPCMRSGDRWTTELHKGALLNRD